MTAYRFCHTEFLLFVSCVWELVIFLSQTSFVTFHIFNCPRIRFYCLRAKWTRAWGGGTVVKVHYGTWGILNMLCLSILPSFYTSMSRRLWSPHMTGQSCPISCMLQSVLLPSYSHMFPSSWEILLQKQKPMRSGWCGQKCFEVCFCGESFIRTTIRALHPDFLFRFGFSVSICQVWGQSWMESKCCSW